MAIRSRLKKKWNDIQVGRQGSYSIERLESFNAYCDTTSRTRVILVCLLAPIPSLAIAILLECLPLCHPSEGWRANWMFWIRQALAALTTAFVGVFSFSTFVPVLDLSLVKILTIPSLLSVMYITTMLVASSKIGFPLPFTEQLGNMVVAAYILIVLVLVLGKSSFTKESTCRRYVLRFQRYQYTYFAFTTLYPFCKALHDSLDPTYRKLIVLILPIWKIGAEYIVISATRELEDIIPQTAGSLLFSISFIVADIGLTLLEFRELRVNAFIVVQLLNQQVISQDSLQSAFSTGSPDLLAMILAVTRDPYAYNIISMTGVRLHACLPHPLPEDRSKQLQILAASGIYCQNITIKTRSSYRISHFFQNLLQQIHEPAQCLKVSKAKNDRRSEDFVLQGLQFLFHREYLALVEYIECVVPIIYVIYKSILEMLPNVVYYPGGPGKWGTFARSNVLVFALLEIGSFLFLHQWIQRKFKVSPIYQVAFVLEKMVWQVQSMLLLSSFLLSYELAHHVDFTFRFDWIR
ncbi:hypothetical protein Plhal703r1_c25g0106451 [Plasmopara halstedii]